MPSFNRSPSLQVEKTADACVLTLLIEMTVGLVSSVSIGDVPSVLKNLRLVTVLRSSRLFSLSCLQYSGTALL